MPLGDAMTIILCSVVPTTIFASIFLKEHFKLYKLVCVCLAVTGVVLVINPTSSSHSDVEFLENKNSHKMSNMTSSLKINERNSEFYYIGVMSALTCMMTIAIFRILMTVLLKNGSTRSTATLLFYHSTGCFLISLLIAPFDGNRRLIFASEKVEQYSLWCWLGLFVIPICHTVMFFTRKRAIQLAGPVITGFTRTSEIGVSYLVQFILFDSPLPLSSFIGAALVIIVCISIIFENQFIELFPQKLHKIL